MKRMIKHSPIPAVKKRTDGPLKTSTGQVCLRPTAFAGPKSVLELPSVHSHKVFKMLCIYFMITAFSTKNQFYHCWVQGKRTPFWRPLGIKKAHQ